MEKLQNKGHIYRQVKFALLANCLSFCLGLENGWISPTAKILQSDLSPIGDSLSDTTISWIASSMSIAAVFGVPLFSYIAEKYGSKAGIIILAVPQSLSLILKISCSSTTSIILARILFGLSGGGVFNIIPMYVKEISEDKTRAILGSLLILFQNVGLFTMYVIGAFLDYYQVLYIMIGLPVMTATLMLKAPESPAFLVKLGKIKEASETLSYLRGLDINDKIVENEIECMVNESQEHEELPNIKSILKDKAWRRALVLIFCLFTFNSLNGSYGIITYASMIMMATGVEFDISPELQTLSLPLVMIIASLLLTVFVERCGRKRLLAGGFFMSTVWMTILGAAILAQQLGSPVPSWLPVLALVMTVAMNAGAVAPLPYIIITEMFSFQVRAKVMGAVVTYSWLLSFATLAIFTPMSTTFGYYTTFFFFGVVNLMGAIFVFVFLPETKGKTDDEIRRILLRRKKGIGN